MFPRPVFLSVVLVMRNESSRLESILRKAGDRISGEVSDYELIIIDNASDDHSLNIFKSLTGLDGLPNLQVFALTKEVNYDTAAWVGLENALGDFIAVVDPLLDDIDFLPAILDRALGGADIVLANNRQKCPQSFAYHIADRVFHAMYKSFKGVRLSETAPSYRLLSRRVVNFILQHPQPAITYRHIPATGGFSRINIEYSAPPLTKRKKRLTESFDRGMHLLVSTTRAPMRLVTGLSLFGAAANFLYSIYVVAVGIFKDDVAPGWLSMSLQQSGMFFLISLVLLVLGEYILQMASLSGEGPQYHIAQELTSARMCRKERLNIKTVVSELNSVSLNHSEDSNAS